MLRRIGYVEAIDWNENTAKIRIPNIDGFDESEYADPDLILLLQSRPSTTQLDTADIPYHLQGLRVKDVVYVLDSEDDGDHLAIVGFYGGTY